MGTELTDAAGDNFTLISWNDRIERSLKQEKFSWWSYQNFKLLFNLNKSMVKICI